MHDPLSDFARRWLSVYRSPALVADFPELALELFRLQYEHNAFYRRFVDANGMSAVALTDWRRIPAVPTVAFKELELTSLPPADRIRVFHSSGTTGRNPSRHYHGHASLRVYEASLEAGFELGFLRGPEPASPEIDPWNEWLSVSLTPPADLVPHSSLVHMIERLGRRSRDGGTIFTGRTNGEGAWEVDFAALDLALEKSATLRRPVILFGTAFGFVHVAERWDREGRTIRLPTGSRVMETGGYKGRSREWSKPELRRAIALRFGVSERDIVGEYGMSELSSQAYERLDGSSAGGFVFPPWARPLVISPRTGLEAADGEPGLLRVLDLANIWSVLAVQTEDLVVRRNGAIEWLGRAPAAEPRGCSLMAA